jgi:hypothetical protein
MYPGKLTILHNGMMQQGGSPSAAGRTRLLPQYW